LYLTIAVAAGRGSNVPVASDDSPDRPDRTGHQELVQEIVADYLRRLNAENNALVQDPNRTREAVRQAELVLGDVILGSGHAAVPVAGEAQLLSVEVGTNRARSGCTPPSRCGLPLCCSRWLCPYWSPGVRTAPWGRL
jgi:hypothetical protein